MEPKFLAFLSFGLSGVILLTSTLARHDKWVFRVFLFSAVTAGIVGGVILSGVLSAFVAGALVAVFSLIVSGLAVYLIIVRLVFGHFQNSIIKSYAQEQVFTLVPGLIDKARIEDMTVHVMSVEPQESEIFQIRYALDDTRPAEMVFKQGAHEDNVKRLRGWEIEFVGVARTQNKRFPYGARLCGRRVLSEAS